jgi:hypothetical protein
METLRDLQEFISYVDFKTDDAKDHKDIYCEFTYLTLRCFDAIL